MSDPLDALRGAHEEEYFRKRNLELVEKLRAKMAAQEAAAGIKAATHIQDDALLEHLAELGITRETAPVLHLVPLLEVAWADGEIQAEERLLLMQAADEAGIEGAARQRFEEMLTVRPKPAFFRAATDFVRAVLAAMPEDQAEAARSNLRALTWRVADAAGGLFGLFNRIEDPEKGALKRIADHLEGHNATSDVLDKL